MAPPRKPRLPPIEPGPSADSLDVCADGVLKLGEAGKFIGKSRRYVYGLIRAGKLPGGFLEGGRRVIPKRVLVRYLAAVRDAQLGLSAAKRATPGESQNLWDSTPTSEGLADTTWD